jgi:hypothetical protein
MILSNVFIVLVLCLGALWMRLFIDTATHHAWRYTDGLVRRYRTGRHGG